LNPEDLQTPYITQKMADNPHPVVAVSDYMRAVPDQIRQFIPNEYGVLGADGFGFSDTRQAARRFFKNDTHSVVVKTLQMLARQGKVDPQAPAQAIEKYSLLDVTAGTTGGAGGDA
ncbi:MAG: pyruvate dehydrogenase (acetyl-transferring), homodimeric type, partial [Arthrobacter sp.]|nr:pyruvate dehydrogenase (acetyl-transferring), homodimeric type [Arthrobacter sp.]